MKSTALLSIFTLVLSISCFAQTLSKDTVKQDLVILKKGTHIFGEIVENIPAQSIKIKSGDSVIEVSYEVVKAIYFETSIDKNVVPKRFLSPKQISPYVIEGSLYKQKIPHLPNVPNTGLYLSSRFQLNTGSYTDFYNVVPLPSFSVAGGYRVNKNIALGVGTELLASERKLYFSTFGEIVLYFLGKQTVPFLSVKSGYLPKTNSATFNPSLGFRIPSKNKFNSHLTVGYYWYNNHKDYKKEYHLVTVGVGMEF